jgi:putative zinc- or iron-chelating protein
VEAVSVSEPEPASTLDELRTEVAQGFVYSHSRANANTSKVLEVASFSYALIELLVERGVVTVEELDERKRKHGQKILDKFNQTGVGVALMKDDQDKYACTSGVAIDCDARMPLCRAACCRLSFALSVQDVEEGRVRWDLGRPYMNRRDADGYCHHLDRGTCACTVYEARPLVCRSYDCRKDTRIWKDFDNRVISPDLDKLFAGVKPGDKADATAPAA